MLVAGAAVAVAAATGGLALGFARRASRPATTALLQLPEARPLGAFELQDSDGRPFALDDLRGRRSLLFFGFTHCPDVCPSTLFDLDRAHGRLAEYGGEVAARCQVVFVSVDPERDTPERLAGYIAYFNPEFRAVTGDHDRLAPLAAQLGIAYRVEEHAPGAGHYDVAHSSSVVLVDPRGRLRGVFAPPLDAAAIARDLAALVTSGG